MLTAVLQRTAASIGIVACAAGAHASRSTARQVQQPAPYSHISGVVVDSRTNQGVPGALVSLGGDAPSSALNRRQEADAGGGFEFRDLPPGSYVLTASKSGYFRPDHELGAPGSHQRRFTLTSGQWVKDARVTLWRHASISGRVLDERGEPVVDEYVRVLIQVQVSGQTKLASGPISRTDDRGMYSVPGLSRGEYVVAVPSIQTLRPQRAEPAGRSSARAETTSGLALLQCPDGSTLRVGGGYPAPVRGAGPPRVYRTEYYPDEPGAADAMRVALDYGDDRSGVDFRLSPQIAWRVAGRVSGLDAPGETVMLRLIPVGSEGLGHGSETATTMVDAGRRFCFPQVPRGTYTLEVTPARGEFSITANPASLLSPATVRLPDTSGIVITPVAGAVPPVTFTRVMSESGAYWARMSLEVRDRDVDNVEVALHPTSRVRGILQLDPASPAPLHRYGAMRLEPLLSNPLLVAAIPDVKEASDRARPWDHPREFEFRGVTPGRYYIRTAGTAAVSSVLWNGRDYSRQPIEIAEGQDVSGLVVTITTKTATLSGIVNDSRGRAGDAGVVFFPQDSDEWRDLGFAPVRMGRVPTDSAGRYTLTGLPAGKYFVTAVPIEISGRWRDPDFLASAAPKAARIDIRWGETHTQNLQLVALGER